MGHLNTGVYIKFEIHIFGHPPFKVKFFSQNEMFYKVDGMRAAGEIFSAFFLVHPLDFMQFFRPLVIIIFPQHDIWSRII